jgi:hypothetical protein
VFGSVSPGGSEWPTGGIIDSVVVRAYQRAKQTGGCSYVVSLQTSVEVAAQEAC